MNNPYTIGGLISFAIGVVAISWWLISRYKALLDENEQIRDYIVQQDKATSAYNADRSEHVNRLVTYIRELEEYIDHHREWATEERDDEEAGTGPNDLADAAFLSDVQGRHGRRGRHAREEVY